MTKKVQTVKCFPWNCNGNYSIAPATAIGAWGIRKQPANPKMYSPADDSFLRQTPWRGFANHLWKATLSVVLSLSMNRNILIPLDIFFVRFLLQVFTKTSRTDKSLLKTGRIRHIAWRPTQALNFTYCRLYDKYKKYIWIKVDQIDDTCFIIYCSTCFRR